MTNDELAAILAKRTPGELYAEHAKVFTETGGLFALVAVDDGAEIIVAAINAIGPLLERVRELERCHKIMAGEVAKYIVLAGKGKNEVAALEDELKRKRRASIVTPQIEAQLAAANERIAEAERLLRRAISLDDGLDAQFQSIQEARKFLESKP